MKCPKCGKRSFDWKLPCECGNKFNFSRIPEPPKQSGVVNDYEAIVGDYMGKIIQAASEFEKKTGVEIVTVVIGNSKPLPPENYAFYLFNKWKLGKKGHEAVLILVSMYERRVEVEIGSGLEKIITDEYSGKLLDKVILPYFKNGKYGEGIFEGVKNIVKEYQDRTGKGR